MLRLKAQQTGFTIVELLIVIVVIGILAAITIVAYNGIQARASDAKIRQAAADIEKAVRRFSLETGNQPWSGSQSTAAVTGNTCPSTTVASGFAGRTNYLCTIDDLLAAGGYIPATLFSSLPQNPTYGAANRTLMFYQCTAAANNKYVLYYYLANPSSDETDKMVSATTECSHTLATYTGYGMRTARIIQL